MSQEPPGVGCRPGPTASGSSPPDEPIMWLSCEVRGDVARVTVAGEIDLSNAHLVAELLESIVVVRAPLVAVDLSAVTFFGAYGISALLRAQRQLTERGGRLTLCQLSPVVRRVLDVTGTLTAFEVVERTPVGAAGRGLARPVIPIGTGS
ncbi:STAS domain-containing protein [Micromonospora sp. C28SCA-DRY-2]|uniref:STAS domain-containing protein n=1 Tax=Micromonospora sp. C28SCA-DRY-2 TaxID=3059522 RepID=UPI002674A659|nr:STAS domain-containing protein [Micromonospora sp. C28SCA-DRY-2]MDO3701428.1 STAS domain-containing protein [Micromonospora sp. C28SCA-DRY-2]